MGYQRYILIWTLVVGFAAYGQEPSAAKPGPNDQSDAANSSGALERIDHRPEIQRRQLQAIGAAGGQSIANFVVREEHIVNGTATFAYGATGALLYEQSDGKKVTACSGTLIGCKTFLTAYHCVAPDPRAGKWFVYLPTEGIIYVSFVPPDPPDGYQLPRADLSVLTLEESVSVVNPVAINTTTQVEVGSSAVIVGYGHTYHLGSDQGIKRSGTIRTADCGNAGDDLICWKLSGQNIATTCNYDSGGPMYMTVLGGEPVVVGVTSAGDECDPKNASYDVDVRSYADWIIGKAGTDVGQTSCGIVTRHLGSNTTVLEGKGELNSSSVDSYTHLLGPAIAQVRVGLNGEEGNSDDDINFNLTVEAGPGNMCHDDSLGNYAYCQLDLDGTPTQLEITVSQAAADSAEYQLLVSAISAADISQ